MNGDNPYLEMLVEDTRHQEKRVEVAAVIRTQRREGSLGMNIVTDV